MVILSMKLLFTLLECGALFGPGPFIETEAASGFGATIGDTTDIRAGADIRGEADIRAGVTIGVMATIGDTTYIGAKPNVKSGAVIKSGAYIGARSKIGTNANIEATAEIGAGATIGARSFIEHGVLLDPKLLLERVCSYKLEPLLEPLYWRRSHYWTWSVY